MEYRICEYENDNDGNLIKSTKDFTVAAKAILKWADTRKSQNKELCALERAEKNKKVPLVRVYKDTDNRVGTTVCYRDYPYFVDTDFMTLKELVLFFNLSNDEDVLDEIRRECGVDISIHWDRENMQNNESLINDLNKELRKRRCSLIRKE